MKELLEYHKLNELGSYFVCLVGYSKGKGSYRIYYNNEEGFRKRFEYIQEKLKEKGYKIYRIGKEEKTFVTNFRRRIYFRKEEKWLMRKK